MYLIPPCPGHLTHKRKINCVLWSHSLLPKNVPSNSRPNSSWLIHSRSWTDWEDSLNEGRMREGRTQDVSATWRRTECIGHGSCHMDGVPHVAQVDHPQSGGN